MSEEPAPSWAERVRDTLSAGLGEPVEVDEGFGPLTVDVSAEQWTGALTAARDDLGCTFFDWLSAVDELTEGFRVVCHVARHRPGGVHQLIVRTLLPREAATLASAARVYAGARWHERETHEMFGVDFTEDHEVLTLEPLLLPENFEGHPLRKDFILASRVAKPFPGAKEPGESDQDSGQHSAAPARRRTRPAGVPEPEQWGPREAGSAAPDTLGAAAAGPATPRPRRSKPSAPAHETGGEPDA